MELKTLAICGVLMAMGMYASFVEAQTITFNFEYPDTGHAGYNFYMDDNLLCKADLEGVVKQEDSSLKMSCERTESIPSGWHGFTMTARNEDESEGPHSQNFNFFIPYKKQVAPTTITIIVQPGDGAEQVILNGE